MGNIYQVCSFYVYRRSYFTMVPRNTWNLSGFPPKRDCSPETVITRRRREDNKITHTAKEKQRTESYECVQQSSHVLRLRVLLHEKKNRYCWRKGSCRHTVATTTHHQRADVHITVVGCAS